MNLARESYLYMFRGVPAISQSDWPFTYNPQLIGQYCNIDPFGLLNNLAKDRSLRFGSHDSNLFPHQLFLLKSWSVAFARAINLAKQALTAYMTASSGSISLVIDLLFHLSLTVLFTIAKHSSLAFEDGTPSKKKRFFLDSYRLSPIVLI